MRFGPQELSRFRNKLLLKACHAAELVRVLAARINSTNWAQSETWFVPRLDSLLSKPRDVRLQLFEQPGHSESKLEEKEALGGIQ